MNKILIAIIGILLLAVTVLCEMYKVQSHKIDTQLQKINVLQQVQDTLNKNNETLKSKLEREHNDKVELNQKIEKLEELAKVDTSFDWSTDISNTLIVKQLRENANRVH